MSLDRELHNIWSGTRYKKPNIFIVFYENEYMGVINDEGNFVKFINSEGTVYVALKSKCTIGSVQDSNCYICSQATPILCSPEKNSNTIEMFVLNKIIPMFY